MNENTNTINSDNLDFITNIYQYIVVDSTLTNVWKELNAN
jgi:hypothetical protein